MYVIQNLDYFTGESKLSEQLLSKDNVEVMLGTTVQALLGDTALEGITIKNSDGETSDVAIDGMFVAIGLIPQNEPFADIISLNNWGYVDADETCLTNKQGFFVAGDCRSKKIRQVATAAADGAVAALAACDYLDK